MPANNNLAALFPHLAKRLLGEPNPALSSEYEYRYGARGSLSVDLRKGTWFDHEAGEGGGVLDLVTRETKLTGPDRLDWLQTHGFLYETIQNNGAAPRANLIATYDYQDEDGTLLYQVCRFEPKDFRQRRKPRPGDRSDDIKGGWVWKVQGLRHVPYRLPQLLENDNRVICIVEGEKSADKLWKIGIPATCSAGGAGKWREELNEFFVGADVVVIPDYDPQKKHPKTGAPMFHPDGRPILPGQDHAADIVTSLQSKAVRVRLLQLWDHWKQMPLKGDVYDWITNGGTADQLYALIEKTPDWKPQSQSPEADPVDLWGSFEPPPLPRGLLPNLIEEYAFEQGATMGTDPGGVAMAALAVCAAAIPDHIQLLMKQHSMGWRESARLWVALVGMPSTKKSPIIAAAVWPLAKLDAELVRNYLFELQQWEQLDKDEKKTEPKPVQKRLRLEDTTIEAAQEALAGSPNGVLLVQDELSGFFGSLDKYSGTAKNRSFWLQSYNGGQYAISRIVRGVGLIPNLSVCMLGGIQPDVIRQLAAESQDDGFLQRMMVVVLRPAGIGLDVPRPSAVGSYASLVEQLTKLRPPVSGSWNDDNDGVLRFDNRAQDIRRTVEAEHHAIECIETINPKLAAHIGKYGGLFGRLCVTFHCIEHAPNRIPEFVTGETAERVADFMRQFLMPHALAFYGGILGLSNDHDRLANVAGYILAHGKNHLTGRDVQASCRTMRKLEQRDTRAVFEQLEALGWLSQIAGPRPSSPPQWLVNPRVHEKFAERAKTEIVRRKKVQAIILDLAGRKGGK